jgi:hypothetical protein
VTIDRSALALLVALAGCTGAAPSGSRDDIGGGTVRVGWEDGDTVDIAIEVPGTARWCAAARWLELSAVSGDTGVMVALFPAESLARGTYPVGRPARAGAVQQRPGATLGVRWFTPGLVAGYRGWEGDVEITAFVSGAEERTVSGRIEASAAAVTGEGDPLAVEGEFDRVPVTDADSGCASAQY